MDEDEKYNTKENGFSPEGSLPDINKNKPGSQQFQMEDFNSKESEQNEVKGFSPQEAAYKGKGQAKRMSAVTDKLQNIDEGGSHKNGTITGSDHKPVGKYNGGGGHMNQYENNLDNSRSGVQNEK